MCLKAQVRLLMRVPPREVMDGPRGGGGTEADSGGDRVMKEEVGDAEIKQHQHVGEVPPPPLRGASSSSRVSMPPREGEDEGFDRGDDSAPSGS